MLSLERPIVGKHSSSSPLSSPSSSKGGCYEIRHGDAVILVSRKPVAQAARELLNRKSLVSRDEVRRGEVR
ncbi:unnamed protein product [Protopolystoma xenopodis]|uniref:Uncharacterized protein n=1 Tax=Protopolystoma xenopodis TaxID=117903 RepID=A0A448WLV2_9PLAT|nr:unnamed protein product [Protopolystoma xenopodis]